MSNAKLIAGLVGFALLAALVATMFYFKSEAASAKSERDKWRGVSETYAKANADNARAIALLKKARDANDKLAQDLASDLDKIRSRGVETRTVIKEVIRNEPAAADWSSVVVPDGLRDAAQRSR